MSIIVSLLYIDWLTDISINRASPNVHPISTLSALILMHGHSQKDWKIGFQDQLSLNAGQKYCRTLQGEHSAILSTFIELPFVIKIFVLSKFEGPFYTGFTVLAISKPIIGFKPGIVSQCYQNCW